MHARTYMLQVSKYQSTGSDYHKKTRGVASAKSLGVAHCYYFAFSDVEGPTMAGTHVVKNAFL